MEDADQYLSKWFQGASLNEIRRENVKDFFCWSLLNKGEYGLLDDDELEEYANGVEKILGRKLEPGRGDATPLRLTLDGVRMLHRPLLWYMVRFIIVFASRLRSSWIKMKGADSLLTVRLCCRWTHTRLHVAPFI